MRILLVHPPCDPRERAFPLGLGAIAAALEAEGHEVVGLNSSTRCRRWPRAKTAGQSRGFRAGAAFDLLRFYAEPERELGPDAAEGFDLIGLSAISPAWADVRRQLAQTSAGRPPAGRRRRPARNALSRGNSRRRSRQRRRPRRRGAGGLCLGADSSGRAAGGDSRRRLAAALARRGILLRSSPRAARRSRSTAASPAAIVPLGLLRRHGDAAGPLRADHRQPRLPPGVRPLSDQPPFARRPQDPKPRRRGR